MQSDHNGEDSADVQFVTLCGRVFRYSNAANFPQVSYKRTVLRLCTEACLHAFEADSNAFVRAHGGGTQGFEGKQHSAVEVGRQ